MVDTFIRCVEHRERGCKNAMSISEVKVDPSTLTNSNKKIFIFDFYEKNRILLFASPDRLMVLSESLKWHADGAFYTRTKYFGQLWVIHAFFCIGM
jgi:hypothetical protein